MHDLTTHRHPVEEAAALEPSGRQVRVLEPSPPAVDDGDFYADDPAALGPAEPATTVVPRSEGTITWIETSADDPNLATFARARWLGPWNRLGPVPNGYAASRADFHRLAYAVVAAARHGANGKFGLRFTAGGFGTPFFGDDRQVRVVGSVLVDQTADAVRTITPSTLSEAAAFVGVVPSTVAAEGDSPALGDIDAPLNLDPATGSFLGDWFGFAASVLEELRAAAAPDASAGRLQLWPGHFDPAFEVGDEAAGRRATFGASPGDGGSSEPYLYVGPWAGIDEDPYWNATAFPGAMLPYRTLVAAEDQRAAALAFYRRAIELLSAR